MEQRELNFGGNDSRDGYNAWLTQRRANAEALAKKINLPLGHEVEVWLRGNIRLRGQLKLREEFLMVETERLHHLELIVDHVPFTSAEIESCVRLD